MEQGLQLTSLRPCSLQSTCLGMEFCCAWHGGRFDGAAVFGVPGAAFIVPVAALKVPAVCN